MLAQFEAVFPRLIERIYAGDTLSRAVKELPPMMGGPIDYGQFNKWVMKNAARRAIYEEAQEYRAEVWADRIIAHAEGEADENGAMISIERSRLAIDAYKHLMSRHSKKRYGETKTVEVEHRISIRSALEQAQQRVLSAAPPIDVEAEVLEEDEDE